MPQPAFLQTRQALKPQSLLIGQAFQPCCPPSMADALYYILNIDVKLMLINCSTFTCLPTDSRKWALRRGGENSCKPEPVTDIHRNFLYAKYLGTHFKCMLMSRLISLHSNTLRAEEKQSKHTLALASQL